MQVMLIAKSISLSDIGIFEGAAQSAQQQNLNHAPCVRRFGDIVNVRRTKPRKGSGFAIEFCMDCIMFRIQKNEFRCRRRDASPLDYEVCR